jgi:2,4-dienoyl-CoA reductase-like NADH-dependent reductase (Old Yellow Enzyme family)
VLADAGALGVVQLFHGGERAPAAITGQPPWSAMADGARGADSVRPATSADIVRVISQFRDAAKRASDAGFAGVELHGAHGFLFGQFLSAMNARIDAWGGSLDARARLIRETMRAVRSAVPRTFVVGVRLSPEDHGNARGLDLDESVQVARWLCDDGADFVHLSLWDSRENTRKRPREHAVPIFRTALPRDVALIVAGGVWTRADAESLLDIGASGIALGRAAIANPDWPLRAGDASWMPRRPPFTIAELRERGLNAKFAGYMRNWSGFVAS